MHAPILVKILSVSNSFRDFFSKIIGLRTHLGSWRPLLEILHPPLRPHCATVRLSGLYYVSLLTGISQSARNSQGRSVQLYLLHPRLETIVTRQQRRSSTFTFLLLIHHILAPVPSAGKTAIKLHNRSVYDMYHRQIALRDQGSVICLSLFQISMGDLLF